MRHTYFTNIVLAFTGIVLLAGCTAATVPEKKEQPLVLKASSFSALPGWQSDQLIEALPALKASCTRILKNAPSKSFGTFDRPVTYGDVQAPCRSFVNSNFKTSAQLREFMENRFVPYAVQAGSNPEGLFTGYYEAALRGSKKKYGPYRYPLYARPSDLVMVDLGLFRDELKGQRIAGRVSGGNLKPYEDRSQIVRGDWPHNDKVLLWVDSPVDAFFVQIQGSGVIQLDTGEVMRIGYAGQNGHVYYAIGRELVKRGYLSKDEVSMQAIRDWLEAQPQQADEIMNTNRSYVFFEEKKQAGAIGGEGVVLTPGRSLAVDHSKLPYGLPVWLSAEAPVSGQSPLQRLLVAQDTGGAIRGAVRGDVFWGFGAQAEAMAGPMKSEGRYWVLLPR